MTCPGCGKGGALTIDSRCSEGTPRRRRECQHCKHRWTTYEVSGERLDRVKRMEQLLADIHRGG